MTNKSVIRTRELNLCTSCEICSAACPVNAIRMEYSKGQFLPNVDKDKCTQCGLCLKVCIGIDIDLSKKHEQGTIRSFDGPSLESYTAYSKNEHIRKNSVSGGLITTFVTELIKAKEFDEVFVLPFDIFDGTSAKLTATHDIEKIFNAAKSKYLPASAYEIIKKLEKGENKNYIIIGTGCLLSGIKKYLHQKNIPEDNLFFLGLFCEKTLNYNFIRYLEKRYARPSESLIKLEYRTKEKYGWPGNTKLVFDSNRELILNRKVRMRLKKYFQLHRCLYCLDKLNVSADIAFGDCYIKNRRNRQGQSSVIVRTEKGKKVLGKYSEYFVLRREQLSDIWKSQSLRLKRKNLGYAKIFAKECGIGCETANNYIPCPKTVKELSKSQRYINLGCDNHFGEIKYLTRLGGLAGLLKLGVKLGVKIAGIILGVIITALRLMFFFIRVRLKKKKEENKERKNIVIVGGQLFNKGAQAMTFTVIDQLKQLFPDKDVYLFCTKDFERSCNNKKLYNLNFLPWPPESRIRLLLGSTVEDKSGYGHMERKIKNVLDNSLCMIDISGFALSSDRGFESSLGYLINILIAKKKSLPFYIFPQSFGPYNYSVLQKLFLIPLLKICLSYPRLIFVREKRGMKHIKRFRKSKVELGIDIVLSNRHYNLTNIYHREMTTRKFSIKPNSIGIIPNVMITKRIQEDELYETYQSLIRMLISFGKNVYILRHSWEDLPICEKIKELFTHEGKVTLIPDDLNVIELEGVLAQFDFVIASRYHSIIHSYKNKVPAVVIGWADKYPELLKEFDQLQYYTDCREHMEKDEINTKVSEMAKNFTDEKQKISNTIKSLPENFVFHALEDDLAAYYA